MEAPHVKDLIRAEEVSFAYPPGKPVLDKVSIRFGRRSAAICGNAHLHRRW